VKRFVLAGREISFEAYPGSDWWRVLVGGAPVPMTFRETESTVTSSGNSYDKELRPKQPVAWAPLGPCLRAPDSFQLSAGRDPKPARGHRASCLWSAGHGEVQGTVLYDIESVILWFPEDLSRVDVEWDHHTDGSV
jgi:hypothetical protein